MLRGRPLLCNRSPGSPSCLHPFYLTPHLCPPLVSCALCGPPWDLRGPGVLRGSYPGLESPALVDQVGVAWRGPAQAQGPNWGNFRVAPPTAHRPCRHQGAITAPSAVSSSQAGAGNRL